MLKHQMSQAELASHLATKCEVTKEAVETLLVELAAIASKQVNANGVFALPGIGRLIKSARPERQAVNPLDGTPIRLKAKVLLKFEFDPQFSKAALLS